MEVEFLADSTSTNHSKRYETYTEIMEEHFPVYLDAGMTAHEYWDEDVALVIAYRRVLERRREWQNQMLWLQGLYIYNALTAVMPALSVKSSTTKIEPYMENPIPITEASRREMKKRKERDEYEKNMAYMRSMADRINAKFEKKGTEVKT